MARLIVGKGQPTIKVTIGDIDWNSKATMLSESVHCEDTPCNSRGNHRPEYGLLTPQPSGHSVHPGKATSKADKSIGVSEAFATAAGLATPTRTPGSKRGAFTAEHFSIDVQTVPRVATSSLKRTPSPSPIRRSHPETPKKARKTGSKSYISDGERQARELENDIRLVARKRVALQRKLKRIERVERGLQSFLIPGPVYDSDSDADTEIIASDTETDTPLKGDQTSVKDKSTTNSLQKAATIGDPITPTGQPKLSTTQQLVAAKTWPIIPARTDETIHSDKDSSVGFTFSADTSTADGLSIRNTTENLAEEFQVPVRDPSTYFVWLDLETNDATRPTRNIRILEIAVCITDKNYVKLDGGISYMVHWPLTVAEVAADMSPIVVNMHKKSGLFSDYESTPPANRKTLGEVEKRVCLYLEKHGIQSGSRALMAGAGIAYDRGIIRHHMPRLDAYFGYQIFDVTSIWHFVRRKYNRRKRHQVQCAHRAWDDIMGAINEAKTYSNTFFKHPRDVCWEAT